MRTLIASVLLLCAAAYAQHTEMTLEDNQTATGQKNFQAILFNGSQVISGLQGTTGAKIFACSGAFVAGNSVTTDANGNCIDSGVSASAPVYSGITAGHFDSSTANHADSGSLRLAKLDSLCWRNNANSGNNCITQDTDDSLNITKPLELNVGSSPTSVQSGVTWLWADTNDLMVHSKQPSNGGDQHLPIAQAVTTTYTNATTTFSTVGPWTWTVAASRTYTFQCTVYFQGSATTAGPKFQATGPASPGAFALGVEGYTNTTALANAVVTSLSSANTALGTLGATATNLVAHVSGALINGSNAGTFVIQAAANGTGTLTIQDGSFCVLQ